MRPRRSRIPARIARHPASLPRLLVAVVALILLSSCDRTVRIGLSVHADARTRWEQLFIDYPLPDGFELTELSRSPDPSPSGASDAAASVRRAAATAHPHVSATPPALRLRRIVAPAMPVSAAGRVVLERTWLAPTGSLADAEVAWWRLPAAAADAKTPSAATEAPLTAAETPSGAAGRVLPVRDIAPPLLARPVDGLSVGDPEYPLVDQLVLELDINAVGLDPEDERRAALTAWFESLPAATNGAPALSWIAGVGDLMVARGVTRLLDRPGGLDVVFSDVLPDMRRADFLLGNLEGAVTTRGTPLEKTFTFRFHPRVLTALAAAGFDYLSAVNNHSYDYGEIGLLDTVAHLQASPIASSGAGRNLAEARRPYRARIGGGAEVVVLSVGAYPVERSGFDGARTTAAGPEKAGVLWADARNPAARRAALEAMREAFGPDTFDIVMVHGGAEWATRPSGSQRELYRSFVDAGADLVLGHHSHVVQGVESYEGALIAYSLGNFVFPGMYVTEYGEESVLLRVGVVDNTIVYVDPVPVRINHQLLSLDRGAAMLERFVAGTRALHDPADETQP